MRRCAENHCVAASDAFVYIEVPSDIGPLGGINAQEVAENGNAAPPPSRCLPIATAVLLWAGCSARGVGNEAALQRKRKTSYIATPESSKSKNRRSLKVLSGSLSRNWRGERGRPANGGVRRGSSRPLHRTCFMARTRSYTKGSRMHAYLARHSVSSPILPRTLQMAFAIALLSCLVVSGPNAVVRTARAATAVPRAAAKGAHEKVGLPHVYLMRGLMNVFSLGMDQLAVLIARHGIEASVYNHAEADAVVSKIGGRYKCGRPHTDYPHWAFAGRRCSNDDGAVLGPGRNTGCAYRSIRWHRLFRRTEERRVRSKHNAAHFRLYAQRRRLSWRTHECQCQRRARNRSFYDRQVAAAPGSCDEVRIASGERTIMSARCRCASTSCSCAAAAPWI
jgi:hypothetical protein